MNGEAGFTLVQVRDGVLSSQRPYAVSYKVYLGALRHVRRLILLLFVCVQLAPSGAIFDHKSTAIKAFIDGRDQMV